eukprot:gene5617-6309_t
MANEIDKDGSLFQEIKEGKAAVLFPKTNTVFYNPVQEFNRDLSVAVIKQFIAIFENERREKLENSKTRSKSYEKRKNGHASETESNMETEPTSEVRGNQNIVPNAGAGAVSGDICTEAPTANLKIKILEGLSATGLRSIRYALEIPNIDQIIANDISDAAVKNIQRNIEHNKVEAIINASMSDAGLLMYQHKSPISKRFQMIDLDPYGSPAMFLDGAVQAVDDGGLLCITCTDMAGLCGNHGEASFAKYGAMPLRSKNCHEMALRLVLGSLDSHAARYKRYIVPMLSVSIDFYIRVFVRVFTSAMEVKRAASKKSYVYQCLGCDSFHLQPLGKNIEDGNKRKYNPSTGPVVGQECQECGQKFVIGGPIWSEPIHSKDFVHSLLDQVKSDADLYKTSQRIKGIDSFGLSVLTVVSEELFDCPLYYVIDKLANVIHCTTPPMLQFRSSIITQGYKVSCSHANSNAIKTSAPNSVIWDILRNWEKLHPVTAEKRKGSSPGAVILSKSPQFECSFDIVPQANPESRKNKISRFPENPQPEWGPKARARGDNRFECLADKRREMQGKKTKRKYEEKDKDYLKQFPCKNFKEGECEFDADNCQYSHELLKISNQEKTDEDFNAIDSDLKS